MKLVLDTNALWSAPLFDALARARAAVPSDPDSLQVVLPAVAYAERFRQMRDRAGGGELLEATLVQGGVRVEPSQRDHAHRLPTAASDRDTWRRHGRDFLIAAHVVEDRIGVTDDAGPAWAGVRTWSVQEATARVEAWVG